MPDIFKKLEQLDSGDAVQIPDVAIEQPPEPEPETPGEHEWSPAETDGPDASGTQQAGPSILSRMELEEKYAEELATIRRETKEQARSQAYGAAFSEKKDALQDCVDRVDGTLAQLHTLHQQFVEEYTQQLKFLAVDIAEKLLCQRIGEDDLALKNLVLQAVSTVKHYKWLTVEVSEQLTELVDTLKMELDKPQYGGKADVSPMPCPEDTCRVSTEDGTVVASISVQAQNLREAFANEENYE